MLHPSVLLLLFLQISAVFCRTTADYKDETQAIENAAVSFSETSEDAKGSDLHHEMHNESAAGQGVVLYGDGFYYRRAAQNQSIAVLVVAITMGLFFLTSCILGCICYFACNSKPRPGYIVGNLAANQTTEVQGQPGSVAMQSFPADKGSAPQYPPTTQPMKQSAPNPYQPSQQQNLYPTVQPSQQ